MRIGKINGKVFNITVEVSDEMHARMKAAPDLAMEAVREGADYWHTKILPRHFDKDARGRYRYAARTRLYSRQKKKGSKPDLVLSGSMRRELTKKSTTKQQAKAVELKMYARVLNFVPNMPQYSYDLKVRQKNGHDYPNMKREIKAITDDEREAVAVVTCRALEEKLGYAGLEGGFGGYAAGDAKSFGLNSGGGGGWFM